MGASAITVEELAAVGGLVGSIVVQWSWDAPSGQGCLPYMQPANFSVKVGTTATFASATEHGTPKFGPYTIGGLSAGATRYIWVAAVDPEGNVGAYAGPVNATTSTQVPPAGSVGPTQTGSNFTSLSSISANLGTITAGSISAITMTGSTITGGLIRTAASGQRIEIDGSTNYITAYNSSGVAVATFGEFSLGPGLDIVILNIDRSSTAAGAQFRNLGTGTCFSAVGQAEFDGSGDRAALTIEHTNSGSTAHGILFETTGGEGICGVSSAGGGQAFYANTGGYGPFTGCHDAFVRKDVTLEIGDVMVSTGRVLARGDGIDNTILELAIAETSADPRVFGVVTKRVPFDPSSPLAGLPLPKNGDVGFVRRWLAANFDRVTVNGLGEGQMLVCGRNGNIANGDLIQSSELAGKGERQDDGIFRSCTVAKAFESVTFDHPDQVKLIACAYKTS